MGTIAQKLEYLNETKQRQKNLINALGGNITNDTPFREYEKELVGVLPKVTGEGTNISLSPTIEYDLEVKSLLGDTKQNTLTGKNLFNKNAVGINASGSAITSTDNGVKATLTTAGNYRYGICVLPDSDNLLGKTVKIKSTITPSASNVGRIAIFELASNNSVVGSSLGKLDATGTSEDISLPSTHASGATKFGLLFYGNVNGTGNLEDYITYSEVLLCLSSVTDTSYEPYCGGIPSPNPNYPQDIQVVTGTQTVTILNSDNTESQTYTLHLGDLELAKIGSYIDKIFIAEEGNEVYDSLTQEQKANLTLGKWYKYGAIGKKTFNGTEYWGQYVNDNLGFHYSGLSIEFKYNFYQGYCNYFTFQNNNSTWTSHGKCGIASSRVFWLLHTDSNINTVDKFKNWLSEHNMIIRYVLDTPTFTEITNETLLSDLEYIRTHAMSYSDTTNIQVEGTLAGGLKVRALKGV